MTEILGNWGSGSRQESTFKKPRKKERKQMGLFGRESKTRIVKEEAEKPWRHTHNNQSSITKKCFTEKKIKRDTRIYIYWQLWEQRIWAFAT